MVEDNADISMFKVFKAGAHIDVQLECENVKNVDDAWENILKTDNSSLKAAKEIVRRHNKTFGGSLTDAETMRQTGLLKIEDCISERCIL